jgi:hydrogenase nickel incorporation protein HypA/HybF
MHELSLALNVVDTAVNEAEKANAKTVVSIELDIGECAGVEVDSFKFVWPAAVKNTILQNSRMNINIITGKAICPDCASDIEVHNLFDPCPVCGSYLKNIYQGKEFRIGSITVN